MIHRVPFIAVVQLLLCVSFIYGTPVNIADVKVKANIVKREARVGGNDWEIKVSGSKDTGKIVLSDVISDIEDKLMNIVPIPLHPEITGSQPFLELNTNGQNNDIEKTKEDEPEYEWEYYFDCDEENSTEAQTDHPHEHVRRRRTITLSPTGTLETNAISNSTNEAQHRDLIVAVKPIKASTNLSFLSGITFHKKEELPEEQQEVLVNKIIVTETPLLKSNDTQNDDTTNENGSGDFETTTVSDEEDEDEDDDCLEYETTEIPSEENDNGDDDVNSDESDLKKSSSDYYPKKKNNKKLGYGAKCKVKKMKKRTQWDISRRRRDLGEMTIQTNADDNGFINKLFRSLRSTNGLNAGIASESDVPLECIQSVNEAEPKDDLKPAALTFPQCASHHFKKQKKEKSD